MRASIPFDHLEPRFLLASFASLNYLAYNMENIIDGSGGPGRDLLFGQDGNDTVLAKDGRTDSLDGGNGLDTAQRDNSPTIKDLVLGIESFI